MILSLFIGDKLNIISIDNRMFGVLQGKDDGSLNERLLQLQYGIEGIKNNIIFGEYAGQVIIHDSGYRSGSMGSYVHNFISYWRQFGLVFCLLSYLCIYILMLRTSLQKNGYFQIIE